MKQHDHPPVYSESAASATIKTVTGWVSRDGYFFGADETGARRAGSSVRICREDPNHGAVPNNGYCKECARIKDEQRWEKAPKVEKSEGPFFLFDGDHFFRDIEEVEDYANDHDLDAVRLSVGEPIFLKMPDAGDLFADDMPDEMDVPCEAYRIVEVARAAIAALPSVGWEASRVGFLWSK